MPYRTGCGTGGSGSALWDDEDFSQLVSAVPAPAYACSPDGLITCFNARAVQLWGREPKLFDQADRYCGSAKLFSPDGAPVPHNRCWMAKALHVKRYFERRPIIIARPDGSRIAGLAHAVPFQTHDGYLLGAINVLINDLGVKPSARGPSQQAEPAQTRSDRLAFVDVSHDAVAQALAVARVRLAAAAVASTGHDLDAIRQAEGALEQAIEDIAG